MAAGEWARKVQVQVHLLEGFLDVLDLAGRYCDHVIPMPLQAAQAADEVFGPEAVFKL